MPPKLTALAGHDTHVDKLEKELVPKDPKLEAGGRRKTLPKLSDGKLASLMEAFQSLDADGNGEVSKEELAKTLDRRFPGVDVQALITVFDTDKNGKISYTEFNVMSKVLSIFSKFDVNEDGVITASEMSAVLAKLGMSSTDVDELMSMYDSNSNGQLDIVEFVTYVHGFGDELGMQISETAAILSGETAVPGAASQLS